MRRDSVTRRDILVMTAAAAAGAVSPVRAQSVAEGFGMPLVELYVPARVLTLEQKSAVVKGFTDVVSKALKLSPDANRRMFVAIIETAEGGFGVNGSVFVPGGK